MDDLITRLRAAIEKKRRIACEAGLVATSAEQRGARLYANFPGATMTELATIEAFANLVAPQDVVRGYEADLRTVDRHAPERIRDRLWCTHCERLWPCVEILDRAAAHNVPVNAPGEQLRRTDDDRAHDTLGPFR